MCDCGTGHHEVPDEMTPVAIEPSGVPLARPIVTDAYDGSDLPLPGPIPDPPTPVPSIPGAAPTFPPFPPFPPIPPIRPCRLDFRDGCYEVTIRRTHSLWPQVGTLRVDRQAPDAGPDGLIVSGDLYNQRLFPWPPIGPLSPVLADPGDHQDAPPVAGSVAAAASRITLFPPWRRRRIPIFPRSRYHSYLNCTRLSVPRFTIGTRPCQVTIDLEQFDYTHPPTGSFKGSFPSSPSRTVRWVLNQLPGPVVPWLGGPEFEGRLFEGGVDRGSVHLTWVSSFLRRAVVEIDTLQGAVAPQPVPNAAGTGTEFFDTVFSGARWQLSVEVDQVDIPVPAGVTPDQCWSSGNLHNLMASVRKATTSLDTEWRTHLIVVPARLGCARGVMYDQIDVPREGSASFSDDGYPDTDSSNFGTAENQRQRDVPRAFLRSATHEVTHAFNQIHQESETMADNSIMSTTPSVANVLGGPATGDPGVFPDQINLALNSTVRNHLAHMPDPVIRPGGWPFASWFPSGAPQAADRNLFDPSEVTLEVTADTDRAALGTPVVVRWTLTNHTAVDLVVPNDLRLEALYATMSVADENGVDRPFRPFVITCERASLAPLGPGEQLSAEHRVFWSSDGFVLERPGRHVVTVAVTWSAGGIPVGVLGSAEVWVDRPVNDGENRDAALVMNEQVGRWVALGGEAEHLTEAVDRLNALDSARGAADRNGTRVADAFADLMPAPQAPAKKAPAKKAPAKKAPAKKAPAKKASKKDNR
jgi:hypothetical protein